MPDLVVLDISVGVRLAEGAIHIRTSVYSADVLRGEAALKQLNSTQSYCPSRHPSRKSSLIDFATGVSKETVTRTQTFEVPIHRQQIWSTKQDNCGKV